MALAKVVKVEDLATGVHFAEDRLKLLTENSREDVSLVKASPAAEQADKDDSSCTLYTIVIFRYTFLVKRN